MSNEYCAESRQSAVLQLDWSRIERTFHSSALVS